jgi:uncharacterized glyoxalase superfamily protein PhnB
MPATEVKSATIYAGLLYEDADKAIEWLERLGFERREIHRGEGGAVAHGELTFGGSILMIGTAGVGREPFASVPAGGTMIYIAVDEIDALYDRARAAGAEVAFEITDTDYGSRDFTLRDPEGNLWAFGTYRPVAG